jgi:hypothetical protein
MTSKQLLLHIGTGKTGTTSIQESLHRAAADGTLDDICYPSPRGPNHNFLAVLYMASDRLPREYRRRYQVRGAKVLARDVKEFREALFDSIRHSPKTILSAEYLGRFGPGELHALRTDLTWLGVDEVLVVAYVRDPASAYLSVVQQKLKASSTFTAPSAYHYPFRQVLQAWNKEFSDLVVRPFARDRLIDSDVVRDFDHVASSFFGKEDGIDLPATVKNQSVSAEGMMVLQRYRQLFHSSAEDQFQWDSGRLIQILQQSMASLDQTRARLSPSVEQVIMTNHENDLEWLSREYGVDLRPASRGETAEHHMVKEPTKGAREMSEIPLILESYDQGTVDELLLYCVREALNELRDSTLAASELRGQLEDARRDSTETHLELRHVKSLLDETRASRSWRWGHRISFILSSPRRLVRAFRRQ